MEQREHHHQRGHRRSGSSSTSSRRSSGLLVCCFSWGSTMKISSKSSLSRRLRRSNNGSSSSSIKGSPMFNTSSGSKKRVSGGGSGFEIDEPSSPKVTCIGLVRVKTKRNQVMKKMRTKSKRRGGEVSFRRIGRHHHHQEGQQGGVVLHHQESLPHRDHKWIHVPFAICAALKGLRNELMNCVLPNCGGRSSATSCTNWGKSSCGGEKRVSSCSSRVISSSSCGAVFMRWLFALEESDEEKNTKRDMEIVVEEEVHQIKRDQVFVREVESESLSSLDDVHHQRGVLDESKEGIIDDDEEEEEEEVQEGRVSICVPPRNALLLMRCRSEPYRTSSLATRFWDDSTVKSDDKERDEPKKEDNQHKAQIEQQEEVEDEPVKPELLVAEENETEQENREKAETEQSEPLINEIKHDGSSPETVVEDDNTAITVMEEESSKLQEEEEEEDERAKCENREQKRLSFSHEPVQLSAEEEVIAALEEERVDHQTLMEEKLDAQLEIPPTNQQEEEEEEEAREIDEEPISLSDGPEAEADQEQQHIVINNNINHSTIKEEDEDEDEEESRRTSNESDRATAMLPECLLLMMREPKVSMELSKETWVCSTDFIRHHQHPIIKPDHQHHQNQVNPINGVDESKLKIKTTHSNIRKPKPRHQPPQPPRSSCSKLEPLAPPPPPPLMASMREKKLVKVNGGAKVSEPFELTRCKSEPMRSSAKLAPEACFWKNMKLIVEPHRRSTVGAAGVGF